MGLPNPFHRDALIDGQTDRGSSLGSINRPIMQSGDVPAARPVGTVSELMVKIIYSASGIVRPSSFIFVRRRDEQSS